MRIKYDFEDEYKGIDLGEPLSGLLRHPKQFLEMMLRPILIDIEDEELSNKEAHFLFNTITTDEAGFEINEYSDSLTTKICQLLSQNDKQILVDKLEEVRSHWK